LPNLDPWINQNNRNKSEEHIAINTISNKFENHLLSIKDEHQKMIHPNSHPTYNEHHEKIIELIEWTMEKYKDSLKKPQQYEEEQEVIIIDNIIEELDKKREVAINKKNKALLKDEVSFYRLEEKTCDYTLFIIRELTGKLY
jgi:hypothetical protein